MNRWRTLARSTNRDVDHAAVVQTLRAIGASVEEIMRPLDLLVGFRGATILVEVKGKVGPRGGKSKRGQKLAESQSAFIEGWKGARPLVVTLETCVAEVCAAVGGADGEAESTREGAVGLLPRGHEDGPGSVR